MADYDAGESAGRASANNLRVALTNLDKYSLWVAPKATPQQNELTVEAIKRVRQMARLVEMISDLLVHDAYFTRLTSPPVEGLTRAEITALMSEWNVRLNSEEIARATAKMEKIFQDIELLTESFYWIAARARNIIRSLPGLADVTCKGIRDVRNQLLEHPEKSDNPVLITSFAWGADCGPVVKGPRLVAQAEKWRDAGLFINANEFSKSLTSTVERLLSSAS